MSNHHDGEQQLMKPRSRQSPGSACEECRRRKLRCDRRDPQCGVCEEAGVLCMINSPRMNRGPRKGHIKKLQERIAALEEGLDNEKQRPIPKADYLPSPQDAVNVEPMLCRESPDISVSSFEIEIPMLMREELDQLYFDRVQAFVPIIHQRRYLLWSRQQAKNEARTSLQYALWALAASFSIQFQQIGESLYQSAQHMLEILEVKDTKVDFIEIERVQAWILLTIYEFMRSCYRQGWMRAGRAFRLVQLMRLYEIDTPGNAANNQDWVEVEEKRRAFWMAYCLDRFVSIRNGWPLTLSEQVIATRLPAPEEEFQSGQLVVMEFPSEAIASGGPIQASSFTECIIITTICGRTLTHQQQALVDNIYVNPLENFWGRYEWIYATLAERLHILAIKSPTTSENIDSMLLFTRMLAQATVLFLYRTLELISSHPKGDSGTMARYDEGALEAAREMTQLMKTLSHVNYFKIHPFTPIPLFLCAGFFNTYRDHNLSFDDQLREIFEILGNLKTVNSLAESFLQIFESNTPMSSTTASSVDYI